MGELIAKLVVGVAECAAAKASLSLPSAFARLAFDVAESPNRSRTCRMLSRVDSMSSPGRISPK